MIAEAAVRVIDIAAEIIYVLLLVRVVLSFVRLPPYHPISRTVGRWVWLATEPLLRPIRRMIDPRGRMAVDVSPLVAYLLVVLVRHLLVRLLLRM